MLTTESILLARFTPLFSNHTQIKYYKLYISTSPKFEMGCKSRVPSCSYAKGGLPV